MTTKTFAKIGYYTLLLGWFIFMWIAVWGSWNRVYGAFVLVGGLGCCIFGAFILHDVFRDDELFKTIDELNKEKRKYQEATKRLEYKIREL